ncbi:hypothetical protein ACX93W_07580 [Paenibacillus sp. CAU 1782]
MENEGLPWFSYWKEHGRLTQDDNSPFNAEEKELFSRSCRGEALEASVLKERIRLAEELLGIEGTALLRN